eukprot:COSAG06_NODE_110_length_23500_cov_328.629204_3_plen_60_part_00
MPITLAWRAKSQSIDYYVRINTRFCLQKNDLSIDSVTHYYYYSHLEGSPSLAQPSYRYI